MTRIRVPIFDCTIGVTNNPDIYAAKKEVERFIGCEVDDWDNSTAYAVSNGSYIGVWIGPDAGDDIIAHECVHVAEGILKFIESDRGKELEEIRATLVGYIFKQIKDALDIKKPAKEKTS